MQLSLLLNAGEIYTSVMVLGQHNNITADTHTVNRSQQSCECIHAGGRVIASPYARKLAREANVDVAKAKGTGPGGRIVAADIQTLLESGGGEAPSEAASPEASSAPAEVRCPSRVMWVCIVCQRCAPVKLCHLQIFDAG